MLLRIRGLEIPKQFTNRLYVGDTCRLPLPENWCNDFCGFLICVVVEDHVDLWSSPDITIKEEASDDMRGMFHDVVWGESFGGKLTWVCTSIGIGASLVPMNNGSGLTDTSTDSSEFTDDYTPKISIRHARHLADLARGMHHLVLNTITHLLPVPLRIFRQFIPLVYLGAPRSGSFGILRQRSITHMCYPPRRALRRSEVFRHWCAAPLSTVYPSTTSESSSGDSSKRPMHSSPHSAGPSRKRCRSSVDSVSLSMPVTGSLSVYLCYHLPPRRGIHGAMTRGSMRCDASTGGTAEAGIDPMTTPLVEEQIVEPAGEDSPDSPDIRDGIVRSVEDMPIDLSDAVRDFYRHMSEVRVDRIVGIETAQGRLEADQLIASGDRARMAEAIYSLRMRNPMFVCYNKAKQLVVWNDHAAIEEMIDQRVKAASRSSSSLTKS
ncbi:hypothetical protein Tco_0956109 [Tanacetum coccineum]|uniref:C-JID domain-containing protein n=1 Tax=Tanacetum coccineum TaxID=301880 RepID=A0ABQ5E945_9ASTR